jgi:hypothetical protein
MTQALDTLVAQLRVFWGTTEPAVPEAESAAVSPAQSREAALEVIRLLSECDPAASEFVETKRALLKPLFDAEGWGKFEKLVQGYGFADAQKLMEQILQSRS